MSNATRFTLICLSSTRSCNTHCMVIGVISFAVIQIDKQIEALGPQMHFDHSEAEQALFEEIAGRI